MVSDLHKKPLRKGHPTWRCQEAARSLRLLLFHGRSEVSPMLAPTAIEQCLHIKSDCGSPPLPMKFSEQRGHDRKLSSARLSSAIPGFTVSSMLPPTTPVPRDNHAANCQNCIFFTCLMKLLNITMFLQPLFWQFCELPLGKWKLIWCYQENMKTSFNLPNPL